MRKTLCAILSICLVCLPFRLIAEDRNTSFTIPTRIIDREVAQMKIIPEDILVLESPAGRDVVPVDKTGRAPLPSIGHTRVAGMTVDEVSGLIFQKTGEKFHIFIATLPQGLDAYPIPQGVAVIGEVNRPGIVNPGRITDIIAQSMGTTENFNGKIVLFRRDENIVVNYRRIVRGQYQYNIIARDGDCVWFGRTMGSSFITSTQPWLGILRDVGLVLIAVVEIANAGEKRKWW